MDSNVYVHIQAWYVHSWKKPIYGSCNDFHFKILREINLDFKNNELNYHVSRLDMLHVCSY